MSRNPIQDRAGDALRAGAERLFQAQHPGSRYRQLAPGEVVLGEVPARAGQVLTVSVISSRNNGSQALLSVRTWSVGPGKNDLMPLKFGMTVSEDSVPRLAGLLAEAMDLLEARCATRWDNQGEGR
jgi:hypothetical protein